MSALQNTPDYKMSDNLDDIVYKMLRPRSIITGSSVRTDVQSGGENNATKPLYHEMTKSFDIRGLEAFERGPSQVYCSDSKKLQISYLQASAESTSSAANLEYQINALYGVLLALYDEIATVRQENDRYNARITDFERQKRKMQDDNRRLAGEIMRVREERDEALKRAYPAPDHYVLAEKSSTQIRLLADRLQAQTERFAAKISLLVDFVEKCGARLADLERTVQKSSSIATAQHRAWFQMIAEYERQIAELEGRARPKTTLSCDE